MARRAATEGGRASGEWTVRDLRSDRSDVCLPVIDSFRICGLFLSFTASWLPRIGIITGEEGVVGLDSVAVLVAGMSLLSFLSCFPIVVFLFSSRIRSFLESLDFGEGDRVKRKLLG